MKKSIALFSFMLPLLAGLFSPWRSCAQYSVELDSCILWAKENYPLIQQYDLIEKSKKYGISHINTGYIPQINLMGMGGYIEGLPELDGMEVEPWKLIGMVQLEQKIWDGGVMEREKRKLRTQAEIDQQNIRINLEAIEEKVIDLYFGILLIEEQQKQIVLQKDNLYQKLKSVRSAMENGTAYSSDLELLQVAILNLEQTQTQTNYQLAVYKKILGNFIHREIDTLQLRLPSTRLRVEQNFDARPEIKLFDLQEKMLDAHNTRIGGILPRVSLMGMAAGLYPDIRINIPNGSNPQQPQSVKFNHIFFGGLTLSWPIGQATYTLRIDNKRLKVEKERIENHKETFLFNSRQNLDEYSTKIQQWDEMIVQDEKIIQIRENIRKSAESKYKNGIISMTELLHCWNEESLAKQNKALHQIERCWNVYKYNHVLGY